MFLFPHGGKPIIGRITPAEQLCRVIELFLEQYDFGIRVSVDVANKGVACAIGMVRLLEYDLPVGRLVGINVDVAKSVVVGVVA